MAINNEKKNNHKKSRIREQNLKEWARLEQQNSIYVIMILNEK